LNSSGAITAETAWSCNHRVTSCSGGGVSGYFAKPSYQSGLSYAKRSLPDISADGDPNTGALVVLKGANYQIGGTSLSAPILAGLFARANADRIANGKAPLGLVNSRIYSLSSSNFRDITSGDNYGYTAGAGYDLVTGLGSPKMNLLIPVLTAQP
jgi:subtilase family serine protease